MTHGERETLHTLVTTVVVFATFVVTLFRTVDTAWVVYDLMMACAGIVAMKIFDIALSARLE